MPEQNNEQPPNLDQEDDRILDEIWDDVDAAEDLLDEDDPFDGQDPLASTDGDEDPLDDE